MRNVNYVVLVLGVFILASCGGGSGGTSPSGGKSNNSSTSMVGTWSGTAKSNLESGKGDMTALLCINDDTDGIIMFGVFGVSDSCFLPKGSIVGIKYENSNGILIYNVTSNDSESRYDIQGTFTSNEITATYDSTGATNCPGNDTGSISLRKISNKGDGCSGDNTGGSTGGNNGSGNSGGNPLYGTWRNTVTKSGQGTYRPMHLILTFDENGVTLERKGYYRGNQDDYRDICTAHFTYSVSGSVVHFKVTGGMFASTCFFFGPDASDASYEFEIHSTYLRLYGEWYTSTFIPKYFYRQ